MWLYACFAPACGSTHVLHPFCSNVALRLFCTRLWLYARFATVLQPLLALCLFCTRLWLYARFAPISQQFGKEKATWQGKGQCPYLMLSGTQIAMHDPFVVSK
jgi:hypothetical protein